MYCNDCGHANPDEAKFCSNCGELLRTGARSERFVRTAGGRNERSERRPSYPHQDSLRVLAETQRLLAARRRNTIAIFAPVGAIVGFSFLFRDASDLVAAGLAATFGALLLGGIAGSMSGRMLAKNYYEIPHSRDGQGGHRCIHCGNRGIYRKGEYKTNNKYANCSRCGEFLFEE